MEATFDWFPAASLTLASGTFMVLLGVLAWALSLRSPTRGLRAVAAVLVIRGAFNVTLAAHRAALDPMTALALAHVSMYLLMAAPVTIVHLMAVYPRRRTWLGRSPWGPPALTLATLGIWVVYAWVHDVTAIPFETASLEGGRIGLGVLLATTAVAAFVFARDFQRAKPGLARRGLAIVTVAFALVPAYWAAAGFASFWPILTGSGGPSLGMPAMVPMALVVGILARCAFRQPRDPDRRLARLALAWIGLAAASAWVPDWDGSGGLGIDALWTLMFPILLTFAVLRHRVIDVDLHAKWTVERSTVVAVFIIIYLVVGRITDPFLTDRFGPTGGVVLLAAILLAIIPAQRLAERFAERVMPGVVRTPAYRETQRLAIYRAAVESSGPPGARSPDDVRMLASLRATLALTDVDHAAMDRAVHGRIVVEVDSRYRILYPLGDNPSTATFLATDTRLGRRVVLKRVRAAGNTDRALAEARILSGIHHPNVVTLHDAEVDGDGVHLVMEHVDGGSLKDRLRDGPMEAVAFDRLACGLLDALATVHAAGIVHRDLKPGNVLLTAEGHGKLADFGIARAPGIEETMGAFNVPAQATGTVRYMSPEQAAGRRVGLASDVWSMAATLFEALTGTPLVAARPNDSAIEVQMRIAALADAPRLVGVPDPLREWLASALAPDPRERFADGSALQEAYPGIGERASSGAAPAAARPPEPTE